jgi:hypothetical protein
MNMSLFFLVKYFSVESSQYAADCMKERTTQRLFTQTQQETQDT